MLTSEELKNITQKPLTDQQALDNMAKEISVNMLIDIKIKLVDAANNRENELIVGKCFRKSGLLRDALNIASDRLIKQGLAINFSDTHKNGKTITTLKIVW